MFKSKSVWFFLIVICLPLLIIQYATNVLENKVELSMKNNNESGLVKFYGEPNINIAMGTFEIKNMKAINKEKGLDILGDLEVKGVSYYNYFINGNLFSDKVVIKLKNLKDQAGDKILDNLVIIENKSDDIEISYIAKSNFIESKSSLDQELSFKVSNVPQLYESMNKELSIFFMDSESFMNSNLKRAFVSIANKATISNINYYVYNDRFFSEILSDSFTEDKNMMKLSILSKLNFYIDRYNLKSAVPNIKDVAKDLVSEESVGFNLIIKNEKNVTIENLVLSAVLSSDPLGKLKSSYSFKIEKANKKK